MHDDKASCARGWHHSNSVYKAFEQRPTVTKVQEHMTQPKPSLTYNREVPGGDGLSVLVMHDLLVALEHGAASLMIM